MTTTSKTIHKTGALALFSAPAMAAIWAPTGEVRARDTLPETAFSSVDTSDRQRLLPLEGGQNFRDVGGYRTADGRMVKRNLIFRSGAMDKLTTADFDYLASLGLRTVVDLRDERERREASVAWLGQSRPQVHVRQYSMDNSAMMAAFAKPDMTAQDARAAMTGLYRDLPEMFAGQYRLIFAELLANRTPLAFNCSAGKDRTGVAAAILLSALGVPRETVIEDYLLSNRYYKPRTMTEGDANNAMLRHIPPVAIQPLMSVDRRYIEAAFATMDAYPGGIEGYYREKFGLDRDKITALRDKFLTVANRP